MTGPRRRGNGVVTDSGPESGRTAGLDGAPDTALNYAAIGATASSEVVAFPPDGFRAAEYRHRVGSGARRFDLAGRSLMTWGALRGAGFDVQDIRAESAAMSPGGAGPLYLDDGMPWITPGMTAVVTVAKPIDWTGPVKVVSVFDEPGRIGYIYGSCQGHPACGERLLVLEHDTDDAVWLTLRSIWRPAGARWSPTARMTDARQRALDERIVKALHPSNVG